MTPRMPREVTSVQLKTPVMMMLKAYTIIASAPLTITVLELTLIRRIKRFAFFPSFVTKTLSGLMVRTRELFLKFNALKQRKELMVERKID
jgi:hypothetical protein